MLLNLCLLIRNDCHYDFDKLEPQMRLTLDTNFDFIASDRICLKWIYSGGMIRTQIGPTRVVSR